ncbi:MAG: YhcH/YjgK/YiaL family protein [Oscillospiraceae bacterium]|nr:YhcH/YjgK/YiaL family protein [Oscillospiraceae bacterium]
MIADKLQNAETYFGCHKHFPAAFAFLRKAIAENYACGRYELEGTELYANIMEYDSKVASTTETHKNYIDIQCIVSGIERMDFCDIAEAAPSTEYNDVKDVLFHNDGEKMGICLVEAGAFAIFFPQDAHKPGLCDCTPAPVKKIVVKVKV